MTRSEFEASVRATATAGYLLTDSQVAAILAAGDQYAAHLIEQAARPQWRPARVLNGAK